MMKFRNIQTLTSQAQIALFRFGAFLEGVKGGTITQEEFVAFLITVEEEVDDPALHMVIDELHNYIQREDPIFEKDHPDVNWWQIAEAFYNESNFSKEW